MSQQPVVPSSPEVSSDDRLWVLLCFILTPIFPIITLLMADKKDRPFVKAHTIPTLILGLVEVVIASVISAILPLIGCFTPLIVVLNIVWALKAYKGEYVEIPFITNFAKQQGWM